MFDMHYDLLSILYYSYLKNDFSYVNEIKTYFNQNNVNELIANLYFMSKDEMKREIGDIVIDVKEMFKVSVSLFKKYFPNIKAIFSIEGCDYVNIDDLEELKELGLGSILLVWNNKNKYGSGVRYSGGLTKDGKRFIKKCVDLGLIIDLSHMNKETFRDTVNLLKEEKSNGKNIKVIVSHSNSSNLYDIPRNISDEDILSLKELKPVIGLVSYSFFLTNEKKSNTELKQLYLNHIKHVVNLISVDNVGVSTDDMLYDKVFFNNDVSEVIFSYKTIKNDIYDLLSKCYNDNDIEKIMYKNIERLY